MIAGERVQGRPVLVSREGWAVASLKRIAFEDRRVQEGWLQELLRRHPELLPVDELEPVFAPLLPIGREVPTRVGAIDHLFISPQGYLTVVETKLWRNPEARREVVGQILDYATELSAWSFEQLDAVARAYTRKYEGSERGVLDVIRTVEPLDSTEEPRLVDRISRNLHDGKFLLLLVGDGIREEVESLTRFLSRTPQLHFTLGLVELRVYEVPERGEWLVLPMVVARTREVVRAVVRVEAREIRDVRVDLEEEPEGKGKRVTLSEEDFFERLRQQEGDDVARIAQRLLEDVQGLGCLAQWRSSSFSVRLPEERTGRLLTLFVVYTNGRMETAWLPEQLKRAGLPPEIAHRYVQRVAQLFPNCTPKPDRPELLSRMLHLSEIGERYDAFLAVLKRTIAEIRQASEESSA